MSKKSRLSQMICVSYENRQIQELKVISQLEESEVESCDH